MSNRPVKPLTVEEMLAALEGFIEDEDAETEDVVITPPEADALTDIADIDDDCTGNVDVDDVPGTRELHAVAHIISYDKNVNETGETPGFRTEIRHVP